MKRKRLLTGTRKGAVAAFALRFFGNLLVRAGLFIEEAGSQGHQALQTAQHLFDDNLYVVPSGFRGVPAGFRRNARFDDLAQVKCVVMFYRDGEIERHIPVHDQSQSIAMKTHDAAVGLWLGSSGFGCGQVNDGIKSLRCCSDVHIQDIGRKGRWL